MRVNRLLSPTMLSVVVLVAILAGSIATSNGATSSQRDPQATTADGIDQPLTLPQSVPGPQGKTGPRGKRGPRGPRGNTGARGKTGAQGKTGATGAQGLQGTNGTAGVPGSPGATGATGPSGLSAFAEFFALMPPDNPATVASGTAVDFPQDGPSSGSITRLGADTFNLAQIGTYRVSFSVPVTEAGQLVVTLNSSELAYTVVGRATGTSLIAGESLVATTSVNSVLSIDNPTSNSPALTITPLSGGTHPASASLIIEQLN